MLDWTQPIPPEVMYGRWHLPDDVIEEILDRSRAPRPSTVLQDLVGELGVGRDSVVLDIGARDGAYALSVAAEHGCCVVAVEPSETNLADGREARAEHAAGASVWPVRGVMEAIPARTGSVDLVWARDVFSHIADLPAALAECRRAMAPGAALLSYQTFATSWLEPAEAARLYAGLAVVPERMDPGGFERAAGEVGLGIERVDVVGSEWREHWEEDGSRRTSHQLLVAARLIRARGDLRAELGDDLYRLELANALWGVYQMIGKLEPRNYVLRAPR